MPNDIFSLVGTRKVRVSRLGVRLFNAQWPCSKLRDVRAYWFEFNEDGELVDTDVPEQDDGAEALALAEDAKEFLESETVPAWASF